MTVSTVPANGITIAYETFGSPDASPLVLVMGLGVQMIAWHDDFCRELSGRGFFVVRFDNRDAGLSTHMSDAPEPDVMAAVTTGDLSTATYRLEDMADDTVGLMTSLGIDKAHLVGASMGGMIVQCAAIGHPERVQSLTSIMSTPSPQDGEPTEDALAALFSAAPSTRDEAVEQAVSTFKIIGSPGFDPDEQWLRETAAVSYDRDSDPSGVGRQFLAIIASGDRKDALSRLTIPALVDHGDSDPLVTPDGGRATARALHGSKLLMLPGMGHDLPRPVWGEIIDAIEELARGAETS